MSLVGVALIAGGVFLLALGYARARHPWRRYQALKAQDENASRYRAWRGGPARRRWNRSAQGRGADLARLDRQPRHPRGLSR